MQIADRFPGALFTVVLVLSWAHAQARETPTQAPTGVWPAETAGGQALQAGADCRNVRGCRNGMPDWKARKLPLA